MSSDTGTSGRRGSTVVAEPASAPLVAALYVEKGGPRWPRCSAPSCWCATGPRIIPSTGQVYTVEELPAEGKRRVFRYQYLPGGAA